MEVIASLRKLKGHVFCDSIKCKSIVPLTPL